MSGGGDPTATIQEETAEVAMEIKPYSFKSPSKFNREQIRAMISVFDNYARTLSSFLTGYLRTATSIEVASAEQVTYNEFSNILSNPVILTIMELPPLKGSVMFELSANIGYCIIDRVLGGPGYSMKKLRDFSEIEKILLERVIAQMLSFIPEAWENVAAIRPRIEKIETNSQFAQIIAPNEITILVTLSIKIGSVEGMLNFCIPYMVIQSVMDRLNTRIWFTNKTVSDDALNKESIEDNISKTDVPLIAVIGRTRVTVSDVVHLNVGDVIPLDSYINSDLQVMVGKLLKFKAKPGISKGKNAVQITSIIHKEE
jgi:flagellar motor switch protein FliM